MHERRITRATVAQLHHSRPNAMRSLTVFDAHSSDSSHDASSDAARPCAQLAAASLSRRGFVSASALSVLASALAAACGGGDASTAPKGTGNTPATGVTFANGLITIPLAQVPKLASTGGYLITNGDGNDVLGSGNARPNAIVINTGSDQFRAFTSVCTHEQCTVSEFANNRIHCACHDSFYDTTGKPVAGPALRALTEYPVSFNATTQTLTVTRG
jgi:cytochrome b6-f complex iron-sulfur subunit